MSKNDLSGFAWSVAFVVLLPFVLLFLYWYLVLGFYILFTLYTFVVAAMVYRYSDEAVNAVKGVMFGVGLLGMVAVFMNTESGRNSLLMCHIVTHKEDYGIYQMSTEDYGKVVTLTHYRTGEVERYRVGYLYPNELSDREWDITRQVERRTFWQGLFLQNPDAAKAIWGDYLVLFSVAQLFLGLHMPFVDFWVNALRSAGSSATRQSVAWGLGDLNLD